MKKIWSRTVSDVSSDLQKVEAHLQQAQAAIQRVQSKLSPATPAAERRLDRLFTRTHTQLLELNTTLGNILQQGDAKVCSSL